MKQIVPIICLMAVFVIFMGWWGLLIGPVVLFVVWAILVQLALNTRWD